MWRKVVSIWVSMLFALSILYVIDISFDFGIEKVSGTILYVNTTGGGAYTSIQDAINASNDGDTVFVYNGTYYENIVVNRTINLVGEDRDNTTIDGNGLGDVIRITANFVNITGLSVKGSGSGSEDAGIELDDVHNCTVINNNVSSNNRYGIRLILSAGNMITYNNVLDSWRGIYLALSSNNSIIENNISSNPSNGIYFDASSNNYIARNNITANTGDGIYISSSSYNDFIDNNVSDNNKGFYLSASYNNNITNNNISSNSMYGIYLSSSFDNYITGNFIDSNDREGIYLRISSNNIILDNDFVYNGVFMEGQQPSHFNSHTIPPDNLVNGKPLYYYKNQSDKTLDGLSAGQIILANCTNFDVKNLEISNTDAGLEVAYSTNTNITDSNISSNKWYGIYFWSSSNNNITGNNFSNNYYGLYIESSLNNNFKGNDVFINENKGITLESSENNIIMGNTVAGNLMGISLYASTYNNITGNNATLNDWNGIQLSSSSDNNIVDNNVYSNPGEGIGLTSSPDNNITGNTISGNEYYGIYLESSPNNDVISNNFTDDGLFMWGNFISDFNSQNIPANNIVNGKPLYYFKDRSNVTVDGMSVGQLILANCTNVDVKNLEINITEVGIEMAYCTNSNITSNNISSNHLYGIYLESSSSINITGNIVSSNNFNGIYLHASSYNNITENNISSNNNNGLYFWSSSNNNITRNNLSNNLWGIYNRVSSNNNITLNNITNNWKGIHMENSLDNYIHHNNFISNSVQAFDGSNDGNQWDNGYPAGGNYWSDYSGSDFFYGPDQDISGSDGIGDTEYVLDPNSRDNYPLMVPFENSTIILPVHNLDKNTYHITIQEGIDEADPGNRIFVRNGTYYENVVINKTITLIGEDSDITIIDGSAAGYTVEITANWTNVTGFTLTNGWYGILIFKSSNVNITGNTITSNSEMGIFFDRSSDTNITNNTISSNDWGIYLGSSCNNTIFSNNILDNLYGVRLAGYSSYNDISGNDFTDSWYAVYIPWSAEYNEINDNDFTDNGYGIYFYRASNNTASNNYMFNNWAGIYIEKKSCDNIFINNDIYSSDHSIYLEDSSDRNTVKDNTVSNNRYHAVYIQTSNNNTVSGNSISGVGGKAICILSSFRNYIHGNKNKDTWESGIYLEDSSNNTIICNNATSRDWSAIHLYHSTNNTIISNNVSAKRAGIEIRDSSNNTIVDNNASFSISYGIYLYQYSYDNTISGNFISNNGYGVNLYLSSSNYIIDNIISSNGIGIYIDQALNNTIIQNRVSDQSSHGIRLDHSSDGNMIKNNKVWNNSIGISVYDSSRDNNITENNIAANINYGIYFYYVSDNIIMNNYLSWNNEKGIYFYRSNYNDIIENYISNNGNGINLTRSSNNSIHHNNFLYNINQSYDDRHDNYWDNGYPSGGNYWSDYTGLDRFKGPLQVIPGSDEIGDTKYMIDTDSWDNYPLMKPFDIYPPIIQLLSPANNSVFQAGLYIDFLVYDDFLYLVNYSLNGGPNQTLSDPFDISTAGWPEGNYIVQINALDLAGNTNSSWYSFIIDNPPLIALNSPANNSVILPGTVLDFDIIDTNLAQTNYSVNGGPNISLPSPFDITTTGWPDGECTIQVNALDLPGNSISSWFCITIDSTKPDILLNSPLNDSIIPGGTVLEFSIVDVNLMHANYSVNGEPDIPLSSPFNISTTGWTDGNCTVQINAQDMAGNSNLSWYYFTIDSTKPAIFSNTPSNNSVVASGTVLDFSIMDSNLDQVYYNIDGGTSIPFSYPYDLMTSGWVEKDYIIQINASDLAGNSNTSWFLFTIDSTRPIILLNTPPNNSINVAGTPLDFSVSDLNLMHVNYSINGEADTSLLAPFDISTSGWCDGDYNIQLNAVDHAGNSNSSWYFITIDSTKPSILLNAPENNSIIQSGEILDFVIIERNLMHANYSIDDDPAISLSEPFDISTAGLEDGDHTIQINALDLVDNSNSSWFSITIDSTLPTIQLNYPGNHSVFSNKTILDFSIADTNLLWANYSIDGGDDIPLFHPFDISPKEWGDGNHVIGIKAVDSAGNSDSRWYLFTIDCTKPLIFLAVPQNNSMVASGTILFFAIYDQNLYNVTYSVNDGPNILLPMPFNIHTTGWDDGDYTIQICALDFAGNSDTCEFFIVMDSTKPNIILNSPQNNSLISRGTILDFSITDTYLLHVSYSINGEAGISLSAPFDINTAEWLDGDYTLQINTIDLAGNSNISLFNFTIDSTPPTVWFDPSLNHSTIPVGRIIQLTISDPHLEDVMYSVDGGEYLGLPPPYQIMTADWTDGQHQITIDAVDALGNEATIWFEVIVDAVLPYVASTVPTEQSKDVDPNATITITFSEPMDQTNVDNLVTLSPSNEFSFQWDPTGTILSISFETYNLAGGKTYNLIIDSQMSDVNGNPIGTDFVLTFSTIPPVDTDGDGIPDVEDDDDDNDGYDDEIDAFPLNASEWLDTDNDGIGNNADSDDDNDEHMDEDDAFPQDYSEWLDTDGDGIGNNADPDDDDDGYDDEKDDYPLDPNRWKKAKEPSHNLIWLWLVLAIIIVFIIIFMLFFRRKIWAGKKVTFDESVEDGRAPPMDEEITSQESESEPLSSHPPPPPPQNHSEEVK